MSLSYGTVRGKSCITYTEGLHLGFAMEFQKSPRESGRAALCLTTLPRHVDTTLLAKAANSLFPPPKTPLEEEAAKIIDKTVEMYLTRKPHLLVPGRTLKNHIGDGEKKVFHLDGLAEKDTLQWDEISPFIAQDRREIQQVAELAEKTFQTPCDQLDAMKLLTERMKFFLRESMVSSILSGQVTNDARRVEASPEGSIGKILSCLPHKKREHARLVHELGRKKEELESHSILHGGDYTACPMRGWTSLFRGNPDCMWYRHSSNTPTATTPSEPETLRINAFSIALAELGVFQKGEGGWDQKYPSSPLDFWNRHMAPYI